MAQLRQLLAAHASLVVKCRERKPDFIECSALATMLHSFYTGIENILTRVTREIDGETVTGDRWHRELLLRLQPRNADARNQAEHIKAEGHALIPQRPALA